MTIVDHPRFSRTYMGHCESCQTETVLGEWRDEEETFYVCMDCFLPET